MPLWHMAPILMARMEAKFQKENEAFQETQQALVVSFLRLFFSCLTLEGKKLSLSSWASTQRVILSWAVSCSSIQDLSSHGGN